MSNRPNFDRYNTDEMKAEHRLNGLGYTLRHGDYGYAIFDASLNIPLFGWDYDLTLDEVHELCADAEREAA